MEKEPIFKDKLISCFKILMTSENVYFNSYFLFKCQQFLCRQISFSKCTVIISILYICCFCFYNHLCIDRLSMHTSLQVL